MRDVLGKMRECGKYIKMRDFPHDCGMVDTYANDAQVSCVTLPANSEMHQVSAGPPTAFRSHYSPSSFRTNLNIYLFKIAFHSKSSVIPRSDDDLRMSLFLDYGSQFCFHPLLSHDRGNLSATEVSFTIIFLLTDPGKV